MSQVISTHSIEAATLSLTNAGANSEAKYLKNRDLRLLGLNVSAGTTTVTVEIDWGSGNTKTINSLLLGNLTTSASNTINTYYWDGSWQLHSSTIAGGPYSAENKAISISEVDSYKYKIDFLRASSMTLKLSCIFLGDGFTFPYPYKYNYPRRSFVRGEKIIDLHGYPRSFSADSDKKLIWDVTFPMTGTNLTDLENTLEFCQYDKKPFMFLDTIIDSNYRLVRLESPDLTARQPGVDYYEVLWRVVEI